MDYDFSGLTREQAAANFRGLLETIQTTRRDHALYDASLALLVGTGPEPSPSSNGQGDHAVEADQLA